VRLELHFDLDEVIRLPRRLEGAGLPLTGTPDDTTRRTIQPDLLLIADGSSSRSRWRCSSTTIAEATQTSQGFYPMRARWPMAQTRLKSPTKITGCPDRRRSPPVVAQGAPALLGSRRVGRGAPVGRLRRLG